MKSKKNMNAKNVSSVILFYKSNEFFYFLLFIYKSMQNEC